MHKQGQSLIGIIIVLVIVGLIVGGLYLYLSSQMPEMPEITEKPAKEKEIEEKTPEEKIIEPPADTSQWEEFSSVTERFKVLFPTYPNREIEEMKIPNIKSPAKNIYYSSERSDGVIYVVNITIYPPEIDISKTEANLENALNEQLASMRGELISSSFTNFHGYRALDFLVQISGAKTYYIKGRIFMVKYTLYKLGMLYTNQNYSESDYNRFINSFQLIK